MLNFLRIAKLFLKVVVPFCILTSNRFCFFHILNSTCYTAVILSLKMLLKMLKVTKEPMHYS